MDEAIKELEELLAQRIEMIALLQRMASRDPWGDSPDIPVQDYAAYCHAAEKLLKTLRLLLCEYKFERFGE